MCQETNYVLNLYFTASRQQGFFSSGMLLMCLCAYMTDADGFSIFSASLPLLLSSIWYGPRSVHTSLHTRALRACIWLLQKRQITIYVCLNHQQKTNRLNRISLEKPASGFSLTSFVQHPRRCTSGELPGNWRFHLTSTELLFTCSVLTSMSSPGLTENNQRNPCRWNFMFFLRCFSLKFLPPCLGTLRYLHGMQVIHH